ncbi:MAG: hypothetical protein R2882_00350 [Gemmatimonadales bacterium]
MGCGELPAPPPDLGSQPEYVVWILDKGDSFRRAAYPAYKSTREKLDAELQQDFDLALEQVREILDAFRIPIVTVEGFEADDVIGTLACREAGRRPADRHRLGRQGLLPADRAPLPCSIRDGAGRPASRKPGSTSGTLRSASACLRAR